MIRSFNSELRHQNGQNMCSIACGALRVLVHARGISEQIVAPVVVSALLTFGAAHVLVSKKLLIIAFAVTEVLNSLYAYICSSNESASVTN